MTALKVLCTFFKSNNHAILNNSSALLFIIVIGAVHFVEFAFHMVRKFSNDRAMATLFPCIGGPPIQSFVPCT